MKMRHKSPSLPTEAQTPSEEYSPFERGNTEVDEEKITNKDVEKNLVSDGKTVPFGSQHADVAPIDLTIIGLKCFSKRETIGFCFIWAFLLLFY